MLGKEKGKIVILQQNMTLLQNELSKNEIIESLMEIQSSALYAMPKNTSTSEITVPLNVNHSIIYNLSLSNVTLTFIHVLNYLEINYTKNKVMKQKHELHKNNRTQQHAHQQNQLGKLFIGNLNVNVTIDDIYELFGLKTTKYPNIHMHTME